jgi:hypothetical protein
MYASVRRYKTEAATEITRRVNAEFVPIISKTPGFVAYYGIDSGDGTWTSVSIFETQEGAEESNQMAADWADENIAPLISDGPDITAGELVIDLKSA